MSIKKILAFTGIRSDYDLLSGVFRELNDMVDFEIKLIVSGAHLSETYGKTVREIEKDGIPILARIETLIDSNSKSARLKSLSILLQNCLHSVEEYNPDLILYAGDREDVVVGSLVGAYLNIPTAHFYGGDHASDGNVDNIIRHSTSKLSNIHFVSNSVSKERLKKIGEEENRIFNVGSPSLDKFLQEKNIDKEELLQRLGANRFKNYALLIYHPILGEEEISGENFLQILEVLEERNIKAFISYPNVDAGNKNIVKVIEKYQQHKNFVFFKNLERELFINLFRHSSFILGNSSAGLYESAIIKKPAINIGTRQTGRLASENVVFTKQSKKSINDAINFINTKVYQKTLDQLSSPYGDGESVKKIIAIFSTISEDLLKPKINDPLEL